MANLAVYVGIAMKTQKPTKNTGTKRRVAKVNMAKDQMFSIIGHDLRGPVGTINHFLM
jgi:signal transduction histidine kinase